MRHVAILAFYFLIIAEGYSQTKKSHKDDNKNTIYQIDSLVQSLISSKKSAGFMLGIQIQGNKPYLKEYGVTDVQTKRPVKANSIFRIASVTKPMTAVAIMTLVEKGKLSLTDKLSTFFKDFPNGDKITIYHLLSHTSGIPNWWEGGMPSDEPKDFPMCQQPHLYLQRMKTTSFFEPGSKHSYSNSGYVLLGEIIERVSGMNYEKYLRSTIFSKAGMKNTMIENEKNKNANWVNGYKQNSPTDTAFSAPDVYAMPFAAGALRSNAIDLLRFLSAFNAGKLVKEATTKSMTAQAVTNSGLLVYDAMYFPPDFTPPSPPAHIKKYGYGLGFSLMEIYGVPVVWHSGGIAGFNAIMIYLPKTKTKIVLLSNTENGIMPAWEELQKVIIKFN
jgi:D-alanyl-D-alanine carboxypeptidase